MHTHVAKWGASCAIRLPKMAVEMLGLYAGQPVRLAIKGDNLVLTKDAPKYKLSELVAQMDSGKNPELMLDDSPQGEELL
jgi:antitoxin component of MazEF toxin-antitoxin module